MADARPVRVRFAPSPSGDLHVGNIRTALYDWAYARHTGGTFIFRIEDTDRVRVTDEYINAAIETLKWLGLDWDEGPEVGGAHGPYLQSQRLGIYAEWAQRFLDNGDAYHCYCTPEELEEMREKARAEGAIILAELIGGIAILAGFYGRLAAFALLPALEVPEAPP